MASGNVGPQNVGVQIEGLRNLRRTMRAAGEDLKDFKKANLKAAEIAAAASADLAPIGDGRSGKPGRLKASVRASGTQTAGIIRAGRKSVPYAPPIHWGWFRRGIKPQPFLSEGAVSSEGKWLPVYYVDLENIVKRVDGI